MRRTMWTTSLMFATFVTALGVPPALADKAADNTGRNKDHDTTAEQQSNDKQDLELTAKIRRAIIDDKTLSTDAHNVKIITVSGVVTLKGPVRSTMEKSAVAGAAEKVAGPKNVRDELTVAR